jgi:hypothetical protein
MVNMLRNALEFDHYSPSDRQATRREWDSLLTQDEALLLRWATDTIERIQADSPRSRAQRAAEHNQQLLKQMRQQWPQDFAHWWPTVVELIK